MSLNILQLSDIHICNSNSPSAASLLSDNDFQRGAPNTILVTGDIFDYTAFNDPTLIEGNINKAIFFFDELIEAINLTYSSTLNREYVLFVPGNHEISRDGDCVSDHFKNYNRFLLQFYDGNIPSWYDTKDFSFVRTFDEERVVVVGFCSPNCQYQIRDGKYDDYALIASTQLLNIKNKINRNESKDTYSYVAALHHQFLLMEERDKSYIENNYLRNPDQFIHHLSTFGYCTVLHGHKHTKSNRRLNIQADISRPEKMMTVLGCGSLSDNVLDNSFNYVTIFPVGAKYEIEYSAFVRSNAGYLADGQPVKLPIKKKVLDTLLTEELLIEYPDLVLAYEKLCDYDTITHSSDVFRLLDSTLFSLPTASEQIKNIPDVLYFLLGVSHFRFSLRTKNNNNVQQKIFDFIEPICKKYFNNKFNIHQLIQAKDIREIFEIYRKEIKISNSIQKKIITFLTIASLILEFYLIIKSGSQEFYKNFVSKKVDFTYSHANLDEEVRGNSVDFSINDERRSLEISVTCDTAAAIKICSLIVKEFEMILHNYERDFSECGFRVYYVLPQLKNNGIIRSDIDSREFTAYIPKLLPLLAGKNIYSNVETFAREVIQNSIDAINVRKEFDDTFTEEGKINITIGSDRDLQFFEISDNGSGMTRYILERYLTTLGLSYYTGIDYSSQNPQYDPISQFGIGFLSCFMIGKHIEVKTCHYKTRQGLFLDIPNYDGCFFIENDSSVMVGTTIKIWENPEFRNHGSTVFSSEKIIKYINEHILNVNVDIYINGSLVIEKKQYLKTVESITQNFNVQHFVPLTKDKNTGVWIATTARNFSSYSDYGVVVYKSDDDLYVGSRYQVLLNNGILISETKTVDILSIGQGYFSVCANFPPETMVLDVSREKLIEINDKLSLDSLTEVLAKIKTDRMNKKAPYYLLQQLYFPEECSDVNLRFLFDVTTDKVKIIINKKLEKEDFEENANNIKVFLNYLTKNSFDKEGSYLFISETDLASFGKSTVMAYSDLCYILSCIRNDYSKHHSVSSMQNKYNNSFVSALFNIESRNENQFRSIVSAKDKLLKFISTKNENTLSAIKAEMTNNKIFFDTTRANNKMAITNMFKDKRHTAPSLSAEKKSHSLMQIAIKKDAIPDNLREFLSILIRHAYTSVVKNNGQIHLSDIAAVTLQSVMILIDYASVICSYETLEKGIEFEVRRNDFVPNEEWF